jgi:predicted metal-binding protein
MKEDRASRSAQPGEKEKPYSLERSRQMKAGPAVLFLPRKFRYGLMSFAFAVLPVLSNTCGNCNFDASEPNRCRVLWDAWGIVLEHAADGGSHFFSQRDT